MTADMQQALADFTAAIDAAPERMGTPRLEPREPIHPWLRRAIYWRDSNQCGWCSAGWSDDNPLELDHIVPWAAGGSDRSDNLRTLCHNCNEARSNRATDAWVRVSPVGLCDHCHTRPRWDENSHLTIRELDPDSTFRLPIFCGRCGNVGVTTDPRRVL